jgi:hypothetical protein
MSTGGGGGELSLGVERPGREADHLPPPSAHGTIGGVIPPLPHNLHGIVLD